MYVSYIIQAVKHTVFQKSTHCFFTVSGYVVEKREKGMSLWTKANEYPVNDNSFTVSGLPENSEYEFRIAAINAAGTGEASLPCAPIKIKEKIGELSLHL